MPQRMDDELLQQAQAGEESAIAALITAMMPAIRKGAVAAAAPGLDFDDAVFADYFCSPQKSLYTEQHFLFVDRLCYIIISSDQKTFVLVRRELFRGHHQYRNIIFRFTESFGKFISVHFWHHNIKHNKVYMFPVKFFKRIFSVFRSRNGKILATKNRFYKFSRVFVVINDKYMKHRKIPFSNTQCIICIIIAHRQKSVKAGNTTLNPKKTKADICR